MYAPQLAGQPRYCDDQHVRQACVAYVNDNGGIHFSSNLTGVKH